MKIVLDNIVFSLQKSGGVSTLWFELIKKISNDNRFDVYYLEYEGATGNLIRNTFEIPKERILKIKKRNLLIERYSNPKLNIKEPFIFISSYYRYSLNKNAINVTIVHDFTYEYFVKGIAKIVHSFQKKQAILNSLGVISISKNTLTDLYKFIPKYKNDVRVVYNGVSEDFFLIDNPNLLSKYDNEFVFVSANKCLLYVGHRTNYKNFDKVVEAFKHLKDKGYKLVIVGEKFNDIEAKFVNKHLDDNDFILYSRLENDKLNYLYNKSFVLLYPSSYEGFGIPLIEAMKAGCPSIAIKKSSIPEVAGDASILIDAPSSELISSAVLSLEDEGFRKKLLAKGFIQSEKFSWDKTMNEYLIFFEELFNKNTK